MLEVKWSKATYGALQPTYAYEGDACFDLYADDDYDLQPGKVTRLSTGLRVQLPKGYMLQVLCRSSMAKRGVILANAVGVVDSTYAGVIDILLLNTTDKVVIVDYHDRVAQGLLMPVREVEFTEIPDGWEAGYSERGEGGFGSTGR